MVSAQAGHKPVLAQLFHMKVGVLQGKRNQRGIHIAAKQRFRELDGVAMSGPYRAIRQEVSEQRAESVKDAWIDKRITSEANRLDLAAGDGG